jgi:hypothetical protein
MRSTAALGMPSPRLRLGALHPRFIAGLGSVPPLLACTQISVQHEQKRYFFKLLARSASRKTQLRNELVFSRVSAAYSAGKYRRCAREKK